MPFVPFEYHFLDDDYNELYKSELQLGIVMNLFSGIAIVLACLGLFGLSTFVVQQRIKEIGIRKILGASLVHIVGLAFRKIYNPGDSCHCYSFSVGLSVDDAMASGICIPR